MRFLHASMILFLVHNNADPAVDNHIAWKLIPTDTCGITRYQHNTGRIISGKDAKLGQFPWIARLGYKKKFSSRVEFNCAGTLITKNYVITAGHCGSDHHIVRLGEHDTTTDVDCIEGNVCSTYQDIEIGEYIFNGFKRDTFSNDICLILLAQSAVFNEFVKPACLPRSKLLDLNLVGKRVKIAGWGYTNSTSQTVATILQYISVPIVDSTDCDKIYKHQLTKNQCCAGYARGKDSCNGDSGGPMTKSIRLDKVKRTYLIGIVSYGRTDCGEGPAVYTLVSKYMLRILDNILQ